MYHTNIIGELIVNGITLFITSKKFTYLTEKRVNPIYIEDGSVLTFTGMEWDLINNKTYYIYN